jgi:hypothetical protein
MPKPNMRWLLCQAVLACVLIAGCASDPKQPEPSALDEPVDAFEAVGEPRRPAGASNREDTTLSTDIERLQNARRTYEQERARLRAETERRQAECRARDGSREVAIQDGSGDPDATYCQPADGGSQR